MRQNVAQKLLSTHLLEGQLLPGSEIALKIDQTLAQDATGTMVMLELEAMGIKRVKTEHTRRRQQQSRSPVAGRNT